MDYPWTPWRYSYVSGVADDSPGAPACVFCSLLESGSDDRQALVVHRARLNFVVLNRFPYPSGHLMVIPYRHVDSLAAASVETAEEMMRLTQRAEDLLRSLYSPDGVNIGMNVGRAAGHIHMHALPRWFADASFVTVVGETRVLPESLSVTWERVRAAFGHPPK